MSINNEEEYLAIQAISRAVALTLKRMREHARVGMTTLELDRFGQACLEEYGAQSAPKVSYKFPGYTCISVNHEIAHGIPTQNRVLAEGDLVNIDVSAEKDGYFADNGSSFVLGEDIHQFESLVSGSKTILKAAIAKIRPGMKISDFGKFIEMEAKKKGFKVIRNLAGHGIGRKLHESPEEILNCANRFNYQRFKVNSAVAIETFISTHSTYAETQEDGWTLLGNRGGFVAQHEHTLIIRENGAEILTLENGIWDEME